MLSVPTSPPTRLPLVAGAAFAVCFAMLLADPAPANDVSFEFGPTPLLQFPAEGEGGGTCVEDDATLCLLDGVIAVTATWKNQRTGAEGVGHRRNLGERTGAFWFFREDNLEVMIKALDGRAQTGSYWVFLGSLSDVEFRIVVKHTPSGQTKTYFNPPGNLYGIADTQALDGSALTCGGIAGDPCPVGQICDLQQGCGVSDAAGICVEEPEVCSTIFEPVCGCDRMTYSNDCERLRANVTKDHEGECTGSEPGT